MTLLNINLIHTEEKMRFFRPKIAAGNPVLFV